MNRAVVVFAVFVLAGVLPVSPSAARGPPGEQTALDGTPASASEGTAVQAVNNLLQEGWDPLTRDFRRSARRWLERSFADTEIADGKGSVNGLKWSFRLVVYDLEPVVDLDETPGLRSATGSRLAIGIPHSGYWRLGIKGRIKGRAKVKAGNTTLFSWSPSLRFGIGLPRFRTTIGAGLDTTNPFAPRLTGYTFDSLQRVTGERFLEKLNLTPKRVTEASGGGEHFDANANDVKVGLPGISAKLSVTLRMTIQPSRPIGDLDVAAGTGFEVAGEEVPGLNLHTDFQEVRTQLRGKLRIDLPKIKPRNVSFQASFGLPLPSSEPINQFLLAVQGLGGGLPRRWGADAAPAHRTPAPTPSADADLATVSDLVEDRIQAHLEPGSVVTLDAPAAARGPPKARASAVQPATFGAEADSALWTGHYLTAEALRYAATKSPDALARVKRVLAGIDRLFWVTQDAVRVKGDLQDRYTGSTKPGLGELFARVAAPAGLADRFTGGSLAKRKCAYLRPEGGWAVRQGRGTQTPAATYREALKLARSMPSGGRSPDINPVGTVWYGYGCGEAEPTSRDQIAGISMGLAFAHQLVDDPDVRSKTKALTEDLLDYLIVHSWQITVPPGDTHGQNYWGNWDKQLALLRIGATLSPGKFAERYRRVALAAPLVWVPGWLSTLDPIHQYYKFNLTAATLTPALFLEDNPGVRTGLALAQGVMTSAVRHHKNAWFSAAEILGRRPEDRAKAAGEPGWSNSSITRADELRSLLLDWEARRRAVAAGANELPRNKVARVQAQIALWPNDASLYTTLDLKPHCLARWALDPKDRIGRGMDFMWQRHPFNTGIRSTRCTSGGRPTEREIRDLGEPGVHARREGPGVDFLLPYWAAVYSGAISRP